MNNSEKKLKIILVNYRYFISGGPERYMFNIKSLLEDRGHSVIPFSVKHNKNVPSDYEKYFLSPIGDGLVTYFDEYNKTSLKTLIKVFGRMFYSFEAKKKLKLLIKDVSPDLIYVLHYQNKVSASIFDAAKIQKIPVVHRISDFGQICANALFFRPKGNDLCERCLTGSRINAISNKCVQNSYIYSLVKVLSLKLQGILKISKKIDAFVTPSEFTLSKLRFSGIPLSKLIHIPTFFNQNLVKKDNEIEYNNFALYVGRIESEKGLFTLIKAFENTNFNLKIIGFSNTNYEMELQTYLQDKKHNIEFLGKMDFTELQKYLSKCLFTIVPSECYDNFPNSILESFAFKKCVVASEIGSLKELVIDNETGLLFRLKDVNDLKVRIKMLYNDKNICVKMGINGYEKILKDYSSENHYQKLISLFYNVLNK